MRSWTRATSVVAAPVLIVLLGGCGVHLQSEAVPVPSNVIPAPLRLPSAPPPASTAPSTGSSVVPDRTERVRLWFIEDDGLASVESDLPTGTSGEVVLQALAVGPTSEQSDGGLRTIASDPLTGLPFVSTAASATSAPASSTPEEGASTVPSGATPISVTVSSAFASLPPMEQVLLLGQVVLSLTGSGASSVTFIDETGAPLAVPLPDGRLLDVPATARDYTGLIVRP